MGKRQPLGNGNCATNKSAFRLQERKYKQRKHELDLSQTLDWRSSSAGLRDCGSVQLSSSMDTLTFFENENQKVFECQRFPGLFVLPRLLTDWAQWYLAREALCRWSCRTNLDTHYDIKNIANNSLNNNHDEADFLSKSPLFQMWQSEMTSDGEPTKLLRKDVPLDNADAEKWQTPADLISKLRWSLLGVEYDWLNKVYLKPLNGLAVPTVIDRLCCDIIEPLRLLLNYHAYFQAQVGIVNYYGLRDSLTAHVDRSEETMEHPLVSFNVGHSCVFLIGSDDTETEPEALLIHSGDVVIMSGEARRAFHGVPRIIENMNYLKMDKCLEYLPSVFAADEREMQLCMQFMASSRINMNFRQIV